MPKQTGFAAPDAAAISFTSIRIEIWSIASRFKPAAKDRIGSIRKYVVPAFGGSGVALAEG